MSNIIEYALVTGNNVDTFNLDMNEKIKLGWQPFGNISSLVLRDDRLGNTCIHFTQAMVKDQSLAGE